MEKKVYNGRWRWDQGRLDYFQFENIRAIARVLNALGGLNLNTSDDLLRNPLEMNTELPFAPVHYKVWRNYARVFQCSMLATKFDGRLVVSELCQNLSGKDPFSSDEYLNFVFSHFQYPYPAFEGYNTMELPVFPFIAILKFLVAKAGNPISLDNVFRYIIGNNCSGLEDIFYYRNLQKNWQNADW